MIRWLIEDSFSKKSIWPSKSANEHMFEPMRFKKRNKNKNAIRYSYPHLSCPIGKKGFRKSDLLSLLKEIITNPFA